MSPPLPPPKPPPGKLPPPAGPPAPRAGQAAPPPASRPGPAAAPPSQLGRIASGRPQVTPATAEPAAPPRSAPQPPPPAAAAQPASGAGAQPAAAVGPAPAGTRTILVAEDDVSIRNMVSRALRPQYHVYEVVDGQHAIDLLSRLKPPDLMILDITMPHVSGLDVAAHAKADPKLKSVPIIFLTGRDSPKDVIEGIKAGARHYVTKPFNMADLVTKIVKTIGPGKT